MEIVTKIMALSKHETLVYSRLLIGVSNEDVIVNSLEPLACTNETTFGTLSI